MIGSAEMGRRTVQTGEMLPLLERHKIQVLLKAGFSVKATAKEASASVDTVRRVRAEDAVTHVDDEQHRRSRGVGRPSKTRALEDAVLSWLAEAPGLPTQELLRRAREGGYEGHKTAFYAMVAGIRPRHEVPVVRFEGLPGEFSQHDFGEIDVRFVDGGKKRVHFFASRLKYSRFLAVDVVPNEQVETLLRGLARHFQAFGGVPLLAVFDRPRTIVTKGGKGRDVEAYNGTFAQGVLELGVGVEMSAPRSGQQKGAVEQVVKWVKNTFFKHRSFRDEEDLLAQLEAWCVEVNTVTVNRATNEIPEKRRQEELVRLREPRVFPETFVLRFPAFVGPTAEVSFEGVVYSMPAGAVSTPATIYLEERRLRIETAGGRFSATHARRAKGEPAAPLPEHRSEKIAAVHGRRAKLYAKREALLQLGGDALTLLTEVTHRGPKAAHFVVEALYELLEEHGDGVLRVAIRAAVRTGDTTLRGVQEALSAARGEEGVVCPPLRAAQPPEHQARLRTRSRRGGSRS
jgi:transposase